MFKDRFEAGKKLAEKLKPLIDEGKLVDPVVLALPRGGVAVGYEIAKELNIPLDILMVKKIPSPTNPELAIGSVSENGMVFVNKDLIESMDIDEQYIQEVGIEKIQEMARERQSLDIDSEPVEGKDVILVDDGIATGATMHLAAQSIVRELPRSITIASPVAPNDEKILKMIKGVAHHTEILHTPDMFMSVGRWYEDFHQLSLNEVKKMLKDLKG